MIVLLVLFLAFSLNTYTSYYTYGIYQNRLIVKVPVVNSDAVKKGEYLTINQHKYKYKIDEISELKNYDDINYQEYKLLINDEFSLNEVVKITFYYNKKTIIQKIIDIIF